MWHTFFAAVHSCGLYQTRSRFKLLGARRQQTLCATQDIHECYLEFGAKRNGHNKSTKKKTIQPRISVITIWPPMDKCIRHWRKVSPVKCQSQFGVTRPRTSASTQSRNRRHIRADVRHCHRVCRFISIFTLTCARVYSFEFVCTLRCMCHTVSFRLVAPCK